MRKTHMQYSIGFKVKIALTAIRKEEIVPHYASSASLFEAIIIGELL